MDYQKAIDFLYAQLPQYQRTGRSAYKPGLGKAILLDRHFRYPHRNYKSIHVGGTNGKGSVAHFLASILQTAGLRTGLFTSPHLKDFRERIRVNGKPISRGEVTDFVEVHAAFLRKNKPSFFEMSSAMAMDHFYKRKVDVALIEVGMGGRLDSTNIIHPEVSVITNIGTDHHEFLGNDRETIAREKAGIIKDSVPVVVGQKDPETSEIFRSMAAGKKAPLFFAGDSFSADHSFDPSGNFLIMNISHEGRVILRDLKPGLSGIYQAQNVLTALQVVEVLNQNGFNIKRPFIHEGLIKVRENTGIRGRWEVTARNPFTVMDTAHNVEGLKLLIEQVQMVPHERLHIVFGVVREKELTGLLKVLPANARYYFTRSSVQRSMNERKLFYAARELNLRGRYYGKQGKALAMARKYAGAKGLVLVTGSTYLVADLLPP